MRNRSWLGVLLLVLLALALAGCGDDKGEQLAVVPSSTATTATGSAATSSSTPDSTTATAAPPTTTTTAPGLSDQSRLRFDGIGPIKVGMSLDQASAAVGKPVTFNPNYMLDRCAYAVVRDGPAGLLFMVLRAGETDPWRIVRVDVDDDSRIATLSGIRIGATEAEVKRTYSGPDDSGTLAVEQHHYHETGHYITYDVDGPTGLLMLFETDGVTVTRFRSGQQEPVRYVEGCA